ncbi:unnamed protein product [Linum tenue]|uniref:Uncharacterized protein n=1 Tax=Linum tenue TaxID=586396 RepID=A0AAV0JD36_9ROSI|nr:unnamed protein product [Linum tenue]
MGLSLLQDFFLPRNQAHSKASHLRSFKLLYKNTSKLRILNSIPTFSTHDHEDHPHPSTDFFHT